MSPASRMQRPRRGSYLCVPTVPEGASAWLWRFDISAEQLREIDVMMQMGGHDAGERLRGEMSVSNTLNAEAELHLGRCHGSSPKPGVKFSPR